MDDSRGARGASGGVKKKTAGARASIYDDKSGKHCMYLLAPGELGQSHGPGDTSAGVMKEGAGLEAS
jgi:hypothetical protein